MEASQAHDKGPLIRRPDGIESYGGVRCLILHPNQQELISGGSDGYLKRWDVSSGKLGSALQRIPILEERLLNAHPPQVRGLDFCERSGTYTVGKPILSAPLAEFGTVS